MKLRSFIYLDSQQLIKYIDENIIGRDVQIKTPWGIRTGILIYFSDILMIVFILF